MGRMPCYRNVSVSTFRQNESWTIDAENTPSSKDQSMDKKDTDSDDKAMGCLHGISESEHSGASLRRTKHLDNKSMSLSRSGTTTGTSVYGMGPSVAVIGPSDTRTGPTVTCMGISDAKISLPSVGTPSATSILDCKESKQPPRPPVMRNRTLSVDYNSVGQRADRFNYLQ